MQKTIANLKALYEQRPAWTRRGLRNNLTNDDDRLNLRHAVPYVGYIFRSGPWRDAIIKLGVDPRTSPAYRHYQTFMFRLLAREAELARDGGGGRRHNVPRPTDARTESAPTTGHVFTGKQPFAQDGRIWMVGDIQDPQLRAELYPAEGGEGFLRRECEIIADGWYGNGTLAKAKTVMRSKIQALMEGREPVDGEYVRILQLPAHARSEADFPLFTLDPEIATPKEITLATEVRAVIRGSPRWRMLPANAGLVREVGEGRARGKGKQVVKGKSVEFEGREPEPEPGAEKIDEQSEGEEEEIERREMLAAQVAAAAAARDADEVEESDNMEDEDEDD